MGNRLRSSFKIATLVLNHAMTIFTTANRIVEYLSICPGATKDNIAACFQVEPDIAERFLVVLIKEQKVERKPLDNGRNSGDWGYFLKENEIKWG